MSGIPRQECERLRERLPEYADGALAGSERIRIETHLARCPRCAAEVEDLRTMLRAVHAVTPDEVSGDLLRRVREAVRQRPPAPAGLPRILPRIAVPVALAVGVVAVGFALRTPRDTARMAAAPGAAATQAAAPDGARPALDELAGRAGARGGGAMGARGRAAGGRATSGPLAIAEATEEALGDRPRHAGGANLGSAQPAETQEHAAGRTRKPAGQDMGLYAYDALSNAAAAKAVPGPAGPAGTSEIGAAQKVGSEGTAGAGIAGRGGGIGGGGMRTGAGSGAGSGAGIPPGTTFAEKRSARSGVARRGGSRGDQDARGPLNRMTPGDGETAFGAISEVEAPPAPSPSAALLSGHYEDRPALTLQLASDKPAAGMSVYLGEGTARRLVWQGSSLPPAPLVLTPEHIGTAPAATSISIESGGESRSYVLFTPTLARLGDLAENAPAGAYAGESVAQALAELTALTGLVVFAEEPLCHTLSGGKPTGAPEAALRELAARAGLEVERAGDVVFNLKHPR